MLDLNLHLFLTQSLPAAILFLLLLFILGRLLFSPALRALDAQDGALASLRSEMEEARKDALRLQEANAAEWNRAKTESGEAREKRLIEAGAQAESLIESAKEKVKLISAEARKRADQESTDMRASLLPQVDGWAGRVVQRLLHS